jgi:hypothetical protein
MTMEEYFDYMEEQFKDPNTILTFEDIRPLEIFETSIFHERAVGMMSAREQFIYKLVLVMTNGQNAETHENSALWSALAMAALYGDGKGRVRFNFERSTSAYAAELFKKSFDEYFKPKSVNEAFQIVHQLTTRLIKDAPGTPLALWAEAQLLGKSSSTTKIAPATLSKSEIFSQNSSLYGLPLGRTSDGSIISYTGNRAMVTIAPPESGKSLSQAAPALRSFAGHVFVLDIKGQLFERTAKERQQAFGSRIVNFNPLAGNTAHYNPLQFVSDHPDECWGESAILAELIVPIRNSKDASWETMAQRLLALFIAYTVLTEQTESRSMNKVLDLVAGIGTAEAMTLITSGGSQFPSAMQRAARTVLSVQDPKSHAQFTGILQAMEQNLSIWNDPRVERASDRCDWSPTDFRGTTPISTYLTIPLESISTYAPLIRVMTAQHVFQLMRKIPSSGSIPILFLLDEFPQLGRMDPVRKAIEVGREYGIRTWLFAQFAHQFEETYGQAGKGMIDICGVRMFMNPTFKDAEAISKEFGSQPSLLSEQKQNVLPADVIIGPEHRNNVFVLSTSETPMILIKNFPPRNSADSRNDNVEYNPPAYWRMGED